MMDNCFDYNVVKHLFDTNPDYTPNVFIYNDVMRYSTTKNISKIFELLKSHNCYPKYINIVKYVIRYHIDISLETLNTDDLDDDIINHSLKLLINNVVINPDDKKIYIPKYGEYIVLPVNRYFDDDDYVNINIFLASIIGIETVMIHEDKIIRVKDFRNIAKQNYNNCTYINIYDIFTYIHTDVRIANIYRYIKTDNFIDYVLDKYSP